MYFFLFFFSKRRNFHFFRSNPSGLKGEYHRGYVGIYAPKIAKAGRKSDAEYAAYLVDVSVWL